MFPDIWMYQDGMQEKFDLHVEEISTIVLMEWKTNYVELGHSWRQVFISKWICTWAHCHLWGGWHELGVHLLAQHFTDHERTDKPVLASRNGAALRNEFR
jgi:hypothetical protein